MLYFPFSETTPQRETPPRSHERHTTEKLREKNKGDSDVIERCIIYARVSTKRQNPETQLMPLREFAHQRRWTVVKEVVDFGISGRRKDRPGELEIMDLAHRRAFDVLLVHKLDRFGRSLAHLVNVLNELKARGIDFCSYMQRDVDTTTPLGKMFFNMAAVFAEFEADLIRDRVMAGLDRARAEGKRLGRPRTIQLDPAQVRAALKRYSWRKAAQVLCASPTSLRRALFQNPPENSAEASVEVPAGL